MSRLQDAIAMGHTDSKKATASKAGKAVGETASSGGSTRATRDGEVSPETTTPGPATCTNPGHLNIYN